MYQRYQNRGLPRLSEQCAHARHQLEHPREFLECRWKRIRLFHTWSHVLSGAPTALRSLECGSTGAGARDTDGIATHEIFEISS